MILPIAVRAIFLLQFFFLCSIFSGIADGYTVTGQVKKIGLSLKGSGLSAKASNVKVILNGGQRVAFLRPNGYFSFHNVSAGTHLIEVCAIGYFFSPVRVDVSARKQGKVQAVLTENRRSLIELVLESLSEEQYYEIKEPFCYVSGKKSSWPDVRIYAVCNVCDAKISRKYGS